MKRPIERAGLLALLAGLLLTLTALSGVAIYNQAYNRTKGALQIVSVGRGLTTPQNPASALSSDAILNSSYNASKGALQVYMDSTSADLPFLATATPLATNDMLLYSSIAGGWVNVPYSGAAATPTPMPTATPQTIPTALPTATPPTFPTALPTATPMPTATPQPTAIPLPTGVIMPFAGASAPTGYLLCDGSAVDRTTYAALFTAISTTFGVGNGTTTFNLPDLRGRTGIGAGTGSGLTARTLGGTGGEEGHALSVEELASHSHTFSYYSSGGSTGAFGGAGAVGGTVTTSTSGSGTAHNTMPPYLVVNFIIKY